MYNISHLSRCTHHIKIELNSDYDDDGSAYSLMLMMTTMIMEYFICYIWVRYMLQKSVKQNKILGYLSVSAWKIWWILFYIWKTFKLKWIWLLSKPLQFWFDLMYHFCIQFRIYTTNERVFGTEAVSYPPNELHYNILGLIRLVHWAAKEKIKKHITIWQTTFLYKLLWIVNSISDAWK